MPTATASIAAVLTEYEISRELGRGAMGVVYLGRHRRLGRSVAIKELSGSLADDPEVRSRFVTEARTLAALDHPHIVPIYDYVESGGRCLLIMEALPGGTVWSTFTSKGLSMPRSLALVLAVCSGVHHAHTHGVLHRDLKPENLLFTAEGELKVADFGIAKVLDGGRTLATLDGSVLGTPAYMSPEQAEGATVGPQADVYAIGTILYELASGRLPFEGDSPMSLLVQRITADPPDLAVIAPTVPAGIAAIVMRCLRRDPADRFESAEALGCALGEAAVAALGPDWLTATGLSVSGSRAILVSASTAQRSAPPSNGQPRETPGQDTVIRAPGGAEVDPTILPRSEREVAPTVAPRSARPADETTAVVAPTTSDAAATMIAAAATVIRPASMSHAAGFDSSIRRSQLVGIEEVATTTAPIRTPLVVAFGAGIVALLLGLFAPQAVGSSGGRANILSALTINGMAPSATPIDVDFSRGIPIGGVGGGRSATAHLRLAGLPVGSAEAPVRNGRSRFDLRNRSFVVHGPAVMRVSVIGAGGRTLASRDVAVVSSREPWRSAQGPLALLLALAGFASAEASSGRHRKGRVRRDAVLRAAIAGCIGMLGLVVMWSMWRSRPASGVMTLGACAAAALAFGALTVTRARLARRRRLRWRADR